MRTTTKIFLSLLAGLILVSPGQAQTGDWRAVESLAPGTRISVKIRFHMQCNVTRVTDAALMCELVHERIRPGEMTFNRKLIREVRLEHSDQANTAIGASLGGGVGVTVGASLGNRSLDRPVGALVLGTVGAIFGGAFGRDFPIFHGKVIYKR
jgi:hypothetical protein